MKVKVCGMRFPENIRQVAELKPDFMGFIFYAGSKRYVTPNDLKPHVADLDNGISKVGVFVNEELKKVVSTYRELGLDLVQLHGDETLEYVSQLRDEGISVIKVFHISSDFDWKQTPQFESVSDYFLFDTATAKYGGSGSKFDWSQLQHYEGSAPFLLSGGIGSEDIDEVLNVQHPKLDGIDVNSRFENPNGSKNPESLQQLITALRQ